MRTLSRAPCHPRPPARRPSAAAPRPCVAVSRPCVRITPSLKPLSLPHCHRAWPPPSRTRTLPLRTRVTPPSLSRTPRAHHAPSRAPTALVHPHTAPPQPHHALAWLHCGRVPATSSLATPCLVPPPPSHAAAARRPSAAASRPGVAGLSPHVPAAPSLVSPALATTPRTLAMTSRTLAPPPPTLGCPRAPFATTPRTVVPSHLPPRRHHSLSRCRTPLAAVAHLRDDALRLRAAVLAPPPPPTLCRPHAPFAMLSRAVARHRHTISRTAIARPLATRCCRASRRRLAPSDQSRAARPSAVRPVTRRHSLSPSRAHPSGPLGYPCTTPTAPHRRSTAVLCPRPVPLSCRRRTSSRCRHPPTRCCKGPRRRAVVVRLGAVTTCPPSPLSRRRHAPLRFLTRHHHLPSCCRLSRPFAPRGTHSPHSAPLWCCIAAHHALATPSRPCRATPRHLAALLHRTVWNPAPAPCRVLAPHGAK
ncbi:hypothetical protein DENSPDRAFT_886576 [Dentipellis sp. KUC8613]|nr:hypothetical protein DENSPDRAFT_886576 [Dentipellis sp. KUC8613]